MNLSKEIPLSLYVYITREGYNNIVATPQNVSLITAYTQEEALQAVRQAFPLGQQISVELKGTVPIKSVLEMFQKTININILEGNKLESEPIENVQKISEKENYKKIIEGMIKAIDTFVEKPEDKPVLEFALNKMLSLVI